MCKVYGYADALVDRILGTQAVAGMFFTRLHRVGLQMREFVSTLFGKFCPFSNQSTGVLCFGLAIEILR